MNPIRRSDLLSALALPAKLPATEVAPTVATVATDWPNRYFAGTITARLLPQTPAVDRTEKLTWRDRVSRPHRLQVLCPTCGTWQPAGRIAQHHEVHSQI